MRRKDCLLVTDAKSPPKINVHTHVHGEMHCNIYLLQILDISTFEAHIWEKSVDLFRTSSNISLST